MQTAGYDINLISGLADLWKQTTGNPGICIAVIDGLVDLKHSCFKGADLTFLNPLNEKIPQSGKTLNHGTSVASIIFGQHGSPVKGIAPKCRGIIIPIYKEDENGDVIPSSQLDLARAIQHAAENGANIINISGGEFSVSGASESILAKTIRDCWENGILIIAAAGNEGCECLHVPASEETVLAVGATDMAGTPLKFSNWGAAYKKNGILFPGENILTALAGGDIISKSGTSFATPIAAGVAALLMSLQMKSGQPANATHVFHALLNNAIGCNPAAGDNCSRFLAGKINIPATMAEISGKPKITPSGLAKENKMMVTDHRIPAHVYIPNSFFGIAPSSFPAIKQQENTLPSTSDYLTKPKIKEMESTFNETNEFAPIQTADMTPNSTYGVHPSDANTVSSGIEPSCACENKGAAASPAASAGTGSMQTPPMVYAIGVIGWEFRSEASRDSFQQLMGGNPNDPAAVMAFLEQNPEASEDVNFTLNLDGTPIYLLRPMGAFAGAAYARIRSILAAQNNEGVTRVSVPGYIVGKARLLTGQEVAVVAPASYGMYSWSTNALITALVGSEPNTDGKKKLDYSAKVKGIANFFDRVYFELRNLGMMSRERAINYAATNAFQIENVFSHAVNDQMELDTISVEKSPIAKPGSDCWDVKLVFFNPAKRMEQARKVYRFTIDVSHVIPVTVGEVRSWSIY